MGRPSKGFDGKGAVKVDLTARLRAAVEELCAVVEEETGVENYAAADAIREAVHLGAPLAVLRRRDRIEAGIAWNMHRDRIERAADGVLALEGAREAAELWRAFAIQRAREAAAMAATSDPFHIGAAREAGVWGDFLAQYDVEAMARGLLERRVLPMPDFQTAGERKVPLRDPPRLPESSNVPPTFDTLDEAREARSRWRAKGEEAAAEKAAELGTTPADAWEDFNTATDREVRREALKVHNAIQRAGEAAESAAYEEDVAAYEEERKRRRAAEEPTTREAAEEAAAENRELRKAEAKKARREARQTTFDGQRLKTYRKELGLSYRQAAPLCGVTRNAVSKAEKEGSPEWCERLRLRLEAWDQAGRPRAEDGAPVPPDALTP